MKKAILAAVIVVGMCGVAHGQVGMGPGFDPPYEPWTWEQPHPEYMLQINRILIGGAMGCRWVDPFAPGGFSFSPLKPRTSLSAKLVIPLPQFNPNRR